MTIEEQVFQRYRPVFNQLVKFGFQKQKGHYFLRRPFFDQQFVAEVAVSTDGHVSGTVLDSSTNKEYLPLRAAHLGAFASEVQSNYIQLLKQIAEECFVNEPFINPQANRLTRFIKETYGEDPEFVFPRFPHTALFREPEFKKWYAVIQDMNRGQLEKNDSHAKGEPIDVVNLRVTPEQRVRMLKLDGAYPAYGTIKKNWMSVILDGTFDDQTIFKWVKNSHHILTKPKYWIIPANPKYYDIMHAFDHEQIIEWNQAANIRTDDIVFMYVTAPIKSVVYRCQVLKNNLPYNYHDGKLRVKRVMKIKLIHRYAPGKFDLTFLRANGVTTVRGPRHLTKPVLEALLKK